MAKKILVAVDGSPTNQVAVNKALDLAIETGAEITAIAVYDLTGNYRAKTGGMELKKKDVDDYCRKALSYAVNEASARGIHIGTIHGRGSIVGLIVELSGEYDTVICGCRRLTGMRKLFSRSVSEGISRSARCPVLVCGTV